MIELSNMVPSVFKWTRKFSMEQVFILRTPQLMIQSRKFKINLTILILLCGRENVYVRELLYRVERFNAAGNFYVGSRADTAAENYYIVK